MDMNGYRWPLGEAADWGAYGLQDVDPVSTLTEQIHVLTRQVHELSRGLTSTQGWFCDWCGGAHESESCPWGHQFRSTTVEENYIESYPRQSYNPYTNTYNPEWWEQSNLYGSNQFDPMPSPLPQEEEMSDLKNKIIRYFTENESRVQNLAVSIRKMEIQVGQILKMVTEESQECLPSGVEAYPEEQCSDIILEEGERLDDIEQQSYEQNENECVDEEEENNSTAGQVIEEKEKDKVKEEFRPITTCSEKFWPEFRTEQEDILEPNLQKSSKGVGWASLDHKGLTLFPYHNPYDFAPEWLLKKAQYDRMILRKEYLYQPGRAKRGEVFDFKDPEGLT